MDGVGGLFLFLCFFCFVFVWIRGMGEQKVQVHLTR